MVLSSTGGKSAENAGKVEVLIQELILKRHIFILAAFLAFAALPRESIAGACMMPSGYDPIKAHSVIFKGKFIGYEPLSFFEEIQQSFGKDFSQDKSKTMHMVVETDFKGTIKGKDVYLRKGAQGTIDYMRPLVQGHDYIIYTDKSYTLNRCGSEWIDLTTIGPRPPYDYSHLTAYKEKRDKAAKKGATLQLEKLIDLKNCSPEDAECISHLAFLYESGSGKHEENIDKAVTLYQRSAEMGYPGAVFSLGILYSQGRGVEKNPDKALELWRQSAEAEQPIAAQRLGDIYSHARHTHSDGSSVLRYPEVQVKQDYLEALKWYKIAADQDLDYSATRIAEMYEQGLGVKQDYAEAAKWYERALGNPNFGAAYRLGMLNLNGLGVPQNYAAAARLFKSAATGGAAPLKARIELAKLYAQDKGIGPNYGEAWFWFSLGTVKDDKSNEELKAKILSHLSAEEIATVDLRVKQWRDEQMAQIFNHPH